MKKMICIKNENYENQLTIGKPYKILKDDPHDPYYLIRDDENNIWLYRKNSFKSISEIRNDKINKLIKYENKWYRPLIRFIDNTLDKGINIGKDDIYTNDNILHNELIEILECYLIKYSKYYHIYLRSKNKSAKTIKYLKCTCKPLNADGNYILLQNGEDLFTLNNTKKILTNKKGRGLWCDIMFDVTNTKKIEIISIEIEYMDKTKVLIDEYGINDIIIDELN